MKYGFVLLSHKEYDPLYERLLKRLLDFPDSIIAIHHDITKSSFPNYIFDNPRILKVKSYTTSWCHINNVLAVNESLKALYSCKSKPDWYIILSANCYPIKSIKYINDFFKNSTFDAYLDIRPVPLSCQIDVLDKWIVKDLKYPILFRIPFISKKGKFYLLPLRFRRLHKLPFDTNFQLFHGSDWFYLNKNTVKYLMKCRIETHPLTKFYQNKIKGKNQHPCAQEIVIQSILGNSANLVIEFNNYRFIDWTNNGSFHPNTLTIDHLGYIMQTPALFGRKFYNVESKILLEIIDRNILNNEC